MGEAKEAAREAEDSTAVEWLARLGFCARGVIWLVIGLLAMRIAVGDSARADKEGALRAISGQPLGEVLLVVLLIGFLGYAAWRLLEGSVGHRDVEAGRKRTGKRVVSFFRAALYLFFAFTTIQFLASGTKGDKTKPLTARVMSETGGRTLVFLIGAAVLIGGLTIAVRAFRQKFADKLDCAKMPDWLERSTHVLGTAGILSRGAVFTLIGAFFIEAARTFEPDKAKGLDETLKTVAAESYGRGLLFVAALGLLSFAVWSFIEARYRKI